MGEFRSQPWFISAGPLMEIELERALIKAELEQEERKRQYEAEEARFALSGDDQAQPSVTDEDFNPHLMFGQLGFFLQCEENFDSQH